MPRRITSRTAWKNNIRALVYMAAAILVEVAGLAIAYQLLTDDESSTWVPVILVALPGVVYTISTPALRDLTTGVRTVAFALLTLGAGSGLVSLSAAAAPGEAFLPTLIVGSVSLLVTAVVAFIDGGPTRADGPIRDRGVLDRVIAPFHASNPVEVDTAIADPRPGGAAATSSSAGSHILLVAAWALVSASAILIGFFTARRNTGG